MPTEPPGSPKLSIAQALETAVASHGRGDLAQAEPLYQAVLAANPEHGVALQLLGVLRAQQGRHDEGIGLIRAAIDGNPGYAEAHMNLGIVLGQLGRYDEARASLNAALGIDPGLANAHFHLGNALLALGRHAEALDSYRKALALAPQFVDAHNNAGAALIALGRPLWLLLAYAADWRWLTGWEDCPWYPTARLYRQPQPGDWDRAVERVRQALVARAAAGA